MDISLNLKKFLEAKFSDNKNAKNKFLLDSGITASTLSKILNTRLQNPSLLIVIKIADYYGDLIDAVIKNEFHKPNNKYVLIKLSKEQISHNLYDFLNTIIKEMNIDIHSLEKECNIGYNTLYSFIKTPNQNKCLSIQTLLSLSQHLRKPIDDMIKRVCINTY